MTEEGWAKQLERFQEGSPFSSYNEKTGEGLQRGEPTAEELRDQYAAPGRAADHELGVLYRADHETLEDGMCRQARTHARALAAAGIPLALRSVNNRARIKDPVTKERIIVIGSDDALDPEVYRQVGELRKKTIRRTAVCVNHTVITSASQLWRLLVPGYAQNEPKAVESILKASIVYTPWERDRVASDLIDLLNNVGQVWLQCERNVKAFVDSGLNPEHVRLVPNAFESDAVLYQLARGRKRALRNHGSRAFYTIGKWEPRKDHHQLLGAFLRAFTPAGRDTLYLKVHDYREWQGYPTVDESVQHWLAQREVRAQGWTAENFRTRVFVDSRFLSERGIAELHLANDVYVSASHAEGWDYPAFDAASIGNVLVHVGFGGSEDYDREGDIRIPYKLGPVDTAYQWEPECQWAHYDVRELEAALGYARPRPVATEVPVDGFDAYEAGHMGWKMARLVRELAAETGQPLV